MTTPDFLSESFELLLFGGKGGVGKTTTACSAAVQIATQRPEDKILLVSTDPAHSSGDALAGSDLPANLTHVEFDARAEHERFMGDHRGDLKAIAERGTFLEGGDIEKFLDLSMPGLDELMAFLWIAQRVENEDYDTIVVDTAPTGHTLRLLNMPAFLAQWLEALENLCAKHQYMASVFGGGSDDPVEATLEEFGELFDGLEELLSDEDRCRFIPVTIAEPMGLAETGDLLESLEELDIAAPEIIVNRVAPADAGPGLASLAARHAQALRTLPESVAGCDVFVRSISAGEPRGAEALSAFLEGLVPFESFDTTAAESDADDNQAIQGTVRLPSAHGSLVITAGKGGVGKTTLACASAATMAENRRVLIVSTDPAGSLEDAYGTEVGAEPTSILTTDNGKLDALELDADAELEQLRDTYESELEAFLEDAFGGMSLSFDEDAMRSLIDLSPPGLDELMALVRVTELFDAGDYDTIVLDTAPTGHLLELLGLPELIGEWITAIFDLLLEHAELIRLPKVEERMLELNAGLKKLRELLVDETRCCLLPVAIPTELALEETRDLTAACRTLNIAMPAILLNQITPNLNAEPGSLAASVAAREASVTERFGTAIADVPLVRIPRMRLDQSALSLGNLGNQVFLTAPDSGETHAQSAA